MSSRIFLADLNHNGHNVKTFPYAIGCIASYVKASAGDRFEFTLFKSPEELADEFLENPPAVIGFSNYIWNSCLGYALIERIKAHRPQTVIVQGGPNYSEEESEQRRYLESHPLVDFYVFQEGEIPFTRLLEALETHDFDASALQRAGTVVPGVHYVHEGAFVMGPWDGKFTNLDELPSPYLTGTLDKFFEQGLAPLMQFTRGCPFTCTFCVEGLKYYSKLGRSSVSRFAAEIEYAAQRVTGDPTLYLADANFGMYKEDLEVCQAISALQDKYGWPKQMNASTGKNHTERILQALDLLNGAMRMGAAIQSTDPGVLKSIKRSNISTDKIVEAAMHMRESKHRSYSEIILNLPGDNVGAHLTTIKEMIDAGITRLQMYPLLLLPGTEMASPTSREKYGMQTRYRILPRCFGTYRFGDETFGAAELVENVVASSTMSFDDYIYCKLFQLSVELFYNDFYLDELHGLVRHLGWSMFDFVKACHDLLPKFPQDLKEIYEGLQQAVVDELWESRDDLAAMVADLDRLEEYARTEHRNSLATNRAVGVLKCANDIHDIARRAMHNLLTERGIDATKFEPYVEQALEFGRYRKADLLNADFHPSGRFDFDFAKLHERHFEDDPFAHRLEHPREIRFHIPEQKEQEMQALYHTFPDPVLGMRHVLYHTMTATPADYFRSFEYAN